VQTNLSDTYCIIGGGPSGIGIGKCLAQEGFRFKILEAEDDFGGNWYFGKPCGRVYESTHLISSKLNTAFSDYPMPADYPHYPSHRLFLRYLRSVARHFGLYESASFGTSVTRVEPDNGHWRVTASNGGTTVYRGVFVANGMQRLPNYPRYPGVFEGETIHSVDYRSPDVFRGKRVLIVGGGNSGCDIAVDAAQTAASVFHSTRRPYYYMPKFIEGQPTQEWLMELPAKISDPDELRGFVRRALFQAGYDPVTYGLAKPDYDIDQAHPIMNSLVLYHVGHGDIVPVPDVKAFRGRTAVFADGREAEFDLVLLATGYRVAFPFLSPGLLGWKGPRPDLFLYMFHRLYDNLFFSGFVNTAAGFGNVANASGRLFASYLKGYERDSTNFRTFRRLKTGPEPDLGNDRFIASDRHAFEVDLWKLIKTLNFLRSKSAA
jgi:cation diffusion facilitator CzcD-associated flavoprotein CzcO